MPHEAFISYSQQDKNAADAVVSHLERSGIACWMAPRDILPGASWPDSIVRALGQCRVLVVVFSSHTNASGHVRREIELAVKRGVPVVPVRIEDVTPEGELEFFLSSSHWMDAITPPIEKHISDLARKIRLLVDPEATPSDAAHTVAGAATSAGEGAGATLGARASGALRSPRVLVGVLVAAVVVQLGVAYLVWGGVGGVTGGPGATWTGAMGLDIDARTLADIREYDELRRTGATAGYFGERGPVRYRAWMDAAEKGHPRAQFLAGLLLSDGIGVERDDARAFELFKKSADQGDPAGIVAVGWMHDNGRSVPEDDEIALAFYREAAELNDSIAMANIGYCYRYGFATAGTDLRESVAWYTRAAENGHRGAMWTLSQMYKRGGVGLERDLSASARWLKRAVEAGDPDAQAEEVIEEFVEQLDRYAESAGDDDASARFEKRMAGVVSRYAKLDFYGQLSVMQDWRVTREISEVENLVNGGAARALIEKMVGDLIDGYASSPRSVREARYRSFASATSAIVSSWSEDGQHLRVVDLWTRCCRDVEIVYVASGEYDGVIKQQRACVRSLYAAGRRAEAGAFLDSALAMCEAHREARPWDWYAKWEYANLCFDAAAMSSLVGETGRVQELLGRAWGIRAYAVGREDLVEKYAGRLPLKGSAPAGADDADSAFFMTYADQEARDAFNEKSTVKTYSMKKFTIPTDFGGEKSPFDVYILSGPRAYLELQDQFRWVYECRGGVVPEEVQGSFRGLYELAKKNNVSYQELCVYAINAANEENSED